MPGLLLSDFLEDCGRQLAPLEVRSQEWALVVLLADAVRRWVPAAERRLGQEVPAVELAAVLRRYSRQRALAAVLLVVGPAAARQ